MPNPAHAYLLTFHTYGTRLHGDTRGTVQHQRARARGSPVLAPNPRWREYSRTAMLDEPALLSTAARRVVHDAIVEVCSYRSWPLLAVNVRTNHVHAVVAAQESTPESVMTSFKAWSTRHLREAGLVGRATRVWSRHGSTRYLWSEPAVQGAIVYVVDWQG